MQNEPLKTDETQAARLFCLTDMSITALVACAIGSSAVLWASIVNVL